MQSKHPCSMRFSNGELSVKMRDASASHTTPVNDSAAWIRFLASSSGLMLRNVMAGRLDGASCSSHAQPSHLPARRLAFVSAVQLRGGRKTLREAERIPIIENIASAPVLQDKYPHRSPLEHMGGSQWQHCQSSPEERHATAALMPGLWFVYASNGGGGAQALPVDSEVSLRS
ncbi:hypothetical protein BGZ61DRAFT_577413 [Ilyonectria robusta]|uniref:uncharacterized protein n=1 Tax=Ilyonectria robusta TaxID=1079257 RepID=UPI001E8E863C|nr:uncharacterized protein BGZ61DRAFT_577413 [Ilyonectria robusta]KAH8699911.1 hypothetical protein BGZ61DRAFT_577413 [Ilyonectria robusta]